MEQGEVFRLLRKGELNAGQQVSIPLEQGGVFRPIESTSRTTVAGLSQSLWNRAGSFDGDSSNWLKRQSCLNPFGTGQGLSTAGVV